MAKLHCIARILDEHTHTHTHMHAHIQTHTHTRVIHTNTHVIHIQTQAHRHTDAHRHRHTYGRIPPNHDFIFLKSVNILLKLIEIPFKKVILFVNK